MRKIYEELAREGGVGHVGGAEYLVQRSILLGGDVVDCDNSFV